MLVRTDPMPRDQRHVPPGTILEITCRCIGDQFLLAPRPEVREVILGVIGRAQFLIPAIELHAFVFLSNHFHLLLTAHDPETLARFVGYVSSNIARKISRLLGRKGPFWSRRYSDIPILDEGAQIARFKYVLENGCKEGLVSSPLDWPGATSSAALVRGTALAGIWEDTTGLFRAQRRGENPDPGEYRHEYPVRVSPLPCWRDLSEDERRNRCVAMVEEIEAAMAEVAVLGVERIVQQDPFSRPEHSKHSPEPCCHASTKAVWRLWRIAHRELRALYREASIGIRRGELPPTAIPPYTLPPPLHWHPDRNLRPPASGAVHRHTATA